MSSLPSGDPPPATPAPPPEAVLIRLARKAAGLSIAEAVAASGVSMSVARWSQLEKGYETRRGQIRPAVGKDDRIAHMAHVVGITPDRLADTGRKDAADVLEEILRAPVAAPSPEPELTPRDDYEREAASTPGISPETLLMIFRAHRKNVARRKQQEDEGER